MVRRFFSWLLVCAFLLLPGVCLAADFQIVSFELDPLTVITSQGSVDSVLASVEVRNLDSGSKNAVVELDVVNTDGLQMVLPLPSAMKSVGSSVVLFDDSAPDNLFFDVDSSWDPGNYAVYARVYDTSVPRNLHASTVKYLTVGSERERVPELGFFLVPLVAFSVLAVLFYRGH